MRKHGHACCVASMVPMVRQLPKTARCHHIKGTQGFSTFLSMATLQTSRSLGASTSHRRVIAVSSASLRHTMLYKQMDHTKHISIGSMLYTHHYMNRHGDATKHTCQVPGLGNISSIPWPSSDAKSRELVGQMYCHKKWVWLLVPLNNRQSSVIYSCGWR